MSLLLTILCRVCRKKHGKTALLDATKVTFAKVKDDDDDDGISTYLKKMYYYHVPFDLITYLLQTTE